MRWGLGPVFLSECVTSSRRWQTYAIRSLGVAALLVGMGTIAVSNDAVFVGRSSREYAKLGESYFYAMIGVELALVMLAAPAATAGAICLDRARGTLAHVLVTDLSDPEIVLGKLAARLLPVLGLVAGTWPVLALTSLLGGIDPTALTMAFAVILAVALLGCTLSLTLSVWARKAHEVVLATYAFWLLVLLLWPVWLGFSRSGWISGPPPWTLVADPFYLAFAPYAVPGRIDAGDYLGFFAAILGASGALVLVAIRRMRPAACRQAGANPPSRLGLVRRLARRLPGPSLDRNPVLWREWHRSRPSPWMAVLLVLLGGTTSIACIIGASSLWTHGLDRTFSQPAVLAGVYAFLIQLIFGLMMLSAVAAMSVSEERQRGSLDLLAATPLSTWTIVLGKWLGIFRLVPLLAIGPGLMLLALATAHKSPPPPPPPGLLRNLDPGISLGYRLWGAGLVIATILAHGALIASLGLALALAIKRQSRTIALSIGLFLLIAVAWPIAVSITAQSRALGRNLAALSPIMVAGFFTDFVSIRQAHLGFDMLWWTTFWDVEVGFLALGLLGLSLRMFDQGLGRVPERPRQTPLLADFLAILIGMIAVGCLFGAVLIGRDGFRPTGRSFENAAAVFGFTLLVALVFLLLSVLAPLSMAMAIDRQRPGRALDEAAVASPTAGRFVLGRWWETFRLVLLLAIGPGLIAMALATARRVEPPPVTHARPVGTQGASGTPVDEAARPSIPPPPPWELGLRDRLATAAMLVLTILAHGAATASLGLALAIAIPRRRAIFLSAGLFFLAAILWPFPALFLGGRHGLDLAMAGFLMAADSLLNQLVTREPQFPDLLGWAAAWLVLVMLLAIGVLGWSIPRCERRLERRSSEAFSPSPLETAGRF